MIDIFYTCIIALKVIIFHFASDTSWMPFITTNYNQFENVKEYQYLTQNQINPYNTQSLFQKPLLLQFLIHMPKYYYLIVDLAVGHLLSDHVFQKEGFKKAVRIFYHLNPITFTSLVALNTDGIDYLLLFLSIITLKSKFYLISPFLFGTLLYLNPQYLIVIAPIALILGDKSDRTFQFLSKLIAYIAITLISVIILLYYSKILTGDWQFIQTCYIDLYFPKDHKPTIGFLWAVLSGLFSKYKQLYHAIYMIFPICQILPFFNLFRKYTIKNKYNVPFMLGSALFSSFLYFQQITAMNLFIFFLLIFTRYDLVFNNITAFPVIITGLFIAFLAGRLQYLWTNSSTGNPNFPFFQIFVSHIFFVVFVSETIREMLKEYARTKEQDKNKNKIKNE